MKNLINFISGLRIWALFMKEFRHIQRDKQLIAAMILPPTVQLLLLGFALNPEVSNLRLGVVDESRTMISRELVSAFVESQSFHVTDSFRSAAELSQALSEGKLDAGLIVPSDFAEEQQRRTPAKVQLVLDGVNSNTAGIAASYAQRLVTAFNQRLNRDGIPTGIKLERPATPAPSLTAQVAMLYNPGLRSSWFMITGVLGILLILNGSLVAAGAMVKEKESGTVEQLLMTPASATEIIIAKMGPLFVLLSCDIWIALVVAKLVFDIPIRGSLALIYCAGALCVLAGIGLGTFLATISRSQQQAQLLSFFVNPPIAMLSGATTPLEGMPDWLQTITLINPVRHFATIARSILLKGAGFDILYPNFLALLAFAIVLVGISAWRFHKQLE